MGLGSLAVTGGSGNVARGHRLLAVGAAAALSLVGCVRSVPTETSGSLPSLDLDGIARGRVVYVQNCASCHGPRADGAKNWKQPDASGNLPPPPHDDTGHTWRHGDRELMEMIRSGWRDPFNKTPELTMPPFKEKLSDDEISAVITYFKSLWSEEHRRYQLEETRREPMPSPTRSEP